MGPGSAYVRKALNESGKEGGYGKRRRADFPSPASMTISTFPRSLLRQGLSRSRLFITTAGSFSPATRLTATASQPKRIQNKHHLWARFYATPSKMHADDLKHYLADSPPSIVRLEIEKHFEALSDKQKRYAHFISQ